MRACVLVCDGVESITHLSRGRGRSTQETYKPGTMACMVHQAITPTANISNPDIYILPVSSTIRVNMVAITTMSMPTISLPGFLL